MADTITLRKPFDSHVHLRQGAMLRAVAPLAAQKFFSAIVMPNTEPPIETAEQALAYKKEILDSTAESAFEPLMTLYLTKNLTPAEIEKSWAAGVKAVKSYPYGATTNSQWGYPSVLEATEVLKKMEELGMPLLLHGEVHINDSGEEEDPYDGEKLFVQATLPKLLDTYPKLKVSLEHLSTSTAVDFLEKNGKAGQVVGTVTPTHLLFDRRDAFRGGYKTLLHMKPLIKRRENRSALRELVRKGPAFLSAGTDSAPHPESKKFSASAVFGVFNSPIAVELYAQIFDELGCLDALESFLSVNGPRFFNVEPSAETVTLIKKDWQMTEPVVCDDGTKIWPMSADVIHWKFA